MARKLLLVPVLVLALLVTVFDAPATPPDGKGWRSFDNNWAPPGLTDHKPWSNGDGRRIK